MPVSWLFQYAIKQVPWRPLLELLSWYPLVLVKSLQLIWRSGDWFNIKTASYQYRQSHCGDKTILRPSSLHNRISYTGKTTSLYWIRALVSIILKWVAVTWLNSSPPSAAYMCQSTGSALLQVMACCLVGATPLPEPMLAYFRWTLSN